MLPVTVARSSSDNNAICYVLPVSEQSLLFDCLVFSLYLFMFIYARKIRLTCLLFRRFRGRCYRLEYEIM